MYYLFKIKFNHNNNNLNNTKSQLFYNKVLLFQIKKKSILY